MRKDQRYAPYILKLRLEVDVERQDEYPFCLPALRELVDLELHPKVTFFVGENGSGKSTLIEAIAVALDFNAEGGTKNFRFATRSSESDLHRYLAIAKSAYRPRDGFFFRAESFFNVATEIEALGPDLIRSYGGRSLHEQSHGESFMALANNRWSGEGLYILDEPEAALSPIRQLTLLSLIHDLVIRRESQFIIATHSPILMAYPDATIYQLSDQGIERVAYEDTEHYQVTRSFLTGRERYFREIFAEPPA